MTCSILSGIFRAAESVPDVKKDLLEETKMT